MLEMRTAICISGQVRVNEDRLKQIADRAMAVGADVFISVWKNRGGNAFGGGHKRGNLYRNFGSEIAAFFPRNWCDGFEDIFPDWEVITPKKEKITVKELGHIFPGAIIDIEDEIVDLDLPSELNSLRMLYRIWRCNGLKRKHEKKNNFRYDRVIRVRPDILIDFNVLLEAGYSEGDLLLKTRRGETIHDSYWAASSDVDDTMALMFGETLANRQTNWKGIHHELADYVSEKNIRPVNINCVISDINHFGLNSNNERLELIANFREVISDRNNLFLHSGSPKFQKISAIILDQVCATACNNASDNSVELDIEQLPRMAQELDNITETWLALPAVSLMFAKNEAIPPDIRGILAIQIMLYDELTWKTVQGLRVTSLMNLLPMGGIEILPFLDKVDPIIEYPQTNEGVQGLMCLWKNWNEQFDFEKLEASFKEVKKVFLGQNEARNSIANTLRKNEEFEALLKFSRQYLTEFPNRGNAITLVNQAERLVANQEK